MNDTIIKVTKKYIVDLLNSTFFGETISWAGTDLFNEALVVNESEEDLDDQIRKEEQRGVLLVNKKDKKCLRMLITVSELNNQQICYRIKNIESELFVDDLNYLVRPLEFLKVDFSISDLNIGFNDSSAVSFSDNVSKDTKRMFKLLEFILGADIVVYKATELFDDMKDDSLSFPPISGDKHYKPVFGIVNDD